MAQNRQNPCWTAGVCIISLGALTAWAQTGNPAPPVVTVHPAVRATTSSAYEVETVVAATRSGRVLTAFFDGEVINDGQCPSGPDMHRSVLCDNFSQATGPGTSDRFRGVTVPPPPPGGWCFTTQRSAAQRDPIAVADLVDGTLWVGAFQVTDNASVSCSSSIWISKVDPESATPSAPINAVLHDQSFPLPDCEESPLVPALVADKPVLTIGPRPSTTGRALYIPYVERVICDGSIVPTINGRLKVVRSINDGASWNLPAFTGIEADTGGPGTQPQSPGAVVLDNGRLLVTYNKATLLGDVFAIWSDAEGAAGTWQPVTGGGAINPVVVFSSSAAGLPVLRKDDIGGFASRPAACFCRARPEAPSPASAATTSPTSPTTASSTV